MVPLFLLLASTTGALRLNEVLYDPPGPDANHEFVELINTADVAVTLDGVQLRFVNGSDGGASVVWTAAPGRSLAAGARFVVGGDSVRTRDVALAGSLQNGPDALHLWCDGNRIDAVAWGDVPGLGEGSPAPDVSGTSLGRVPDGSDTDSNLDDWRPLRAPTPGAPNAHPHSFVASLHDLKPVWRSRPGPVTVVANVVATGTEARQSVEMEWRLDGLRQELVQLDLAAGDTARVPLTATLGWGAHRLGLVARDDAPLDGLDVPYQVGPAAWSLNEVLVAPTAGNSEFIELRAAEAAPPDLATWTLNDAGGSPREIVVDAGADGPYVVVAADPDALTRTHDIPVEARVGELRGGWNALNNDQDEIELRDPRGAVVDRLVYSASHLGEPGDSLERGAAPGSSQWFPARPPTPGRRNRASDAVVPELDGVSITPDPFTPDGDGQGDVLHIVLRAAAWGAAAASVVDLTGEPVIDLGPAPDTETRQWIWDGRDARGRRVPLGAYVVLIEASRETEVQVWKRLVALAR